MLSTSTYLFFAPSISEENCFDFYSKQKFSILLPDLFDILQFFLEPKTIEEGIEVGFSENDILECIELNFLLKTGTVSIWEKYNWQRSAFLTFSQQDLPYSENLEQDTRISDLTEFRRNLLKQYAKTKTYPERIFNYGTAEIILSHGQESNFVDYNLIANRKCIRKFSSKPISFETFGSILYSSTQNIRQIEKTKTEIFYLLNSFYTWLNLYIVIQKVEGLEKGTYQYNPIQHTLYKIGGEVQNKAIIDCVQGQSWISGSGFCVFFVVQWERYQWLYRHSRAFTNLLIQLGDIGQEFIFNSALHKIGGWMTPALKEEKAAEILQLSKGKQTAMYFLKLGQPI